MAKSPALVSMRAAIGTTARIEAALRALAHLRWESMWQALTGESWDAYQAKVEEGRRWYATMHPKVARFDITVDPAFPALSKVRVTEGIVLVEGVQSEVMVGSKEPTVTLRMPMWNVDLRTVTRQ